MAWYWYAAIYVAGYIVAWRIGYSKGIADDLAQLEIENENIRAKNRKSRSPFDQQEERKLRTRDREENAGFAAAAAAIWPLLAVIVPAYLFATRTTPAEKRYSKREADRKELVSLRKQAKELGLPFPEVDNEPKQ